MDVEERDRLAHSTAPRPLAELLQCPASVAGLLNSASRSLNFDTGDAVFRQDEACQGLYLVVSGLFQRRALRLERRVILGQSRPGDLVELVAVLGEGRHTYTLSALEPGSVFLLPIEALRRAFEAYPPLRMGLMEELAREVSRSYQACCRMRLLAQRSHGRRDARSQCIFTTDPE
jgi:CRP-like cAMP-binding protein